MSPDKLLTYLPGKTQYISFGHSPYVQLATGWHQIGGIAKVPAGTCNHYL